MKKLLSIFLSAIMCLTLAACSGNNEVNDTDSEVVGSDSASTTTISNEDTNVAPKDDSIEITPENWQHYFELGYELYIEYEDDGVTIDDYSIHPCIFIKDGYGVADENEPVEFVFDAEYEWRCVLLNKRDLAYEIGGIDDVHEPDPNETFDITLYPGFEYRWLTSVRTTSGGWTTDTGSIALDDLFYFYIEDAENGQKSVNVRTQQLPILTCTEASGKIIAK